MTNRSMLCLVMNALGIYVTIDAIQLLGGLVMPLVNINDVSASILSSWFAVILVQVAVRVFVAWFLLFKPMAIAKVLIPNEETIAGSELGAQPAISQLWFWIALIGIFQAIGPLSFLLHQFVGPDNVYAPTNFSAGGILANPTTGPQLLLLLLSLLLIIFCKPLGRLIQHHPNGQK